MRLNVRRKLYVCEGVSVRVIYCVYIDIEFPPVQMKLLSQVPGVGPNLRHRWNMIYIIAATSLLGNWFGIRLYDRLIRALQHQIDHTSQEDHN